MKKLIFIQLFIVLCVSGTMAQLEVMSDGKVAIRGTNPTKGEVQVNINPGEGNNKGFCIYDPYWSQVRMKVTGDDYISILDFPTAGQIFAFTMNETCIGDKQRVLNQYGSLGGTLSVFQGYSNFGGAIVAQVVSVNDRIYSGGALGVIGGFYVKGDGNVYSNGNLLTSDSSLKNNIEPIANSLDKVMQLQGVSFNYNSFEKEELNIDSLFESSKKRTPELTREIFDQIQKEKLRKRIGVIAQDVEKILPELVRTREDGLKAVYYPEITAVLIEAIKELKAEIDELKGNSSLRSAPNEPPATGTIDPVVSQCKLYQNTPNPFSLNTEIRFYVPQSVKKAQLCIYNLQGAQIKQIVVTQRGEGSLWISGSELNAGIYLYALIVDGKEVDVKRMILTE